MDKLLISSVDQILRLWKNEPTIASNIILKHSTPPVAARYAPLPQDLHPGLRSIMIQKGINNLYSHQVDSWSAVREGRNIVIVTGTASGKTLCYNLPIINACLNSPDTRALYIFPTKALAQDQYQNLADWLNGIIDAVPPTAGVYDGDTPSSARQMVRSKARIVLTNPDMVHNGILPHHTIWADFFKNLKYIVIDELHTYRGVFGSHLANLVRRLKRICTFYGSSPQFILTSATIANPQQLAEHLTETEVVVISNDGSPHGAKHFLIYNPPLVDPSLGIRASPIQEGTRLVSDLLAYNIQSITFARTRRSVELILKYLRQNNPAFQDSIHGYRSGYLPLERRSIEKGLRTGQIQAVVATNALELGIDIGAMSAAVLIGYPGTIASTRQQSGRAGRKQDASLSIFVASSDPLDQFLVQHPEYLFDRSPEQALIDPDNLLIVLQHIRCAAFELPFSPGNSFGNLDKDLLAGLLSALSQSGELHESGQRYFWMADQYPTSQVSLRSSSPETVLLQSDEDGQLVTVGEVDRASACWMVHPEAVYLHAGQSYLVEDLDLDKFRARLKRLDLDYYTEPRSQTTVEKLSELELGLRKSYGDIKVTTQVVGFRKVRWYTHENLGEGEVDLPPSELVTTGYWLTLEEEIIAKLRDLKLWTGDPNNYGPHWDRIRAIVRQRDHYLCQMCGAPESGRVHHVHHKTPFRTFQSLEEANRLDNLITLCSNCHQKAETHVRMRSGLAGLSYALLHLAPLFLMCDIGDLGSFCDPQSSLANGQPVVLLYDQIPAGIGLSKKLFEIDHLVLVEALELIKACPCVDGCPSCVGPAGENGVGGKIETMAILSELTQQNVIKG